MAIRVQCPGCEKKLKARDELAGKRIKCPSCGQVLVAPAAPADPLRTTDHVPDPKATGDRVPGLASTVGERPAATLSADVPGDLPTVPGYRVLREIARGGMGRVLAAHDLSLDREVALKILLPGANADRFVRESKITACLPHPGIPPVYALGTLADGSPFLAMKLIDGQTLAVEMKTADRPRLLQVFVQVCQVVGFAHSKGVIHRDLKPSNVMVGAFGEVQVMDWGLAKVLTSGREKPPDDPSALTEPPESSGGVSPPLAPEGHTQAGSVMGTPAYMAPEQARGEATDARADVFALGGILCAILTGAPPFGGRSAGEVIQRAAVGDLDEAFARLGDCGADAELVALCQGCLSADPADRPANGRELADEVSAYLDGVQERARSAEREQAVAVVRTSRRKVLLALAAAVVALATLGGLSTAYYFWQRQARAHALERSVDSVVKLRDEAVAQPDDVSRWQAALAAVEQGEAGGDPTAHDRLLPLHTEIRAGLEAAQHNRAVQLDKEGAELLTQSKTDEAIGSWRRAIALDPNVATAHANLGAGLFYKGQLDEAIVCCKEAIALDPKLALAHAGLSSALLEKGQVDDARASWRHATALDPNVVNLHIKLGGALGNKQEYDQAIVCYKKAIELDPKLALAHAGLGFTLIGKGQVNESLPFFRKAIELEPKLAVAHLGLGAALHRKGQTDEGIACYKKAIALDPKLTPAYLALAGALVPSDSARGPWTKPLANGQVDEAIAWLRKAIAIDPKNAQVHANLGAILLRGDLDEALACFRKALELDPKLPNVQAQIDQILVTQGRARRKMNEGDLRQLTEIVASGNPQAINNALNTLCQVQPLDHQRARVLQLVEPLVARDAIEDRGIAVMALRVLAVWGNKDSVPAILGGLKSKDQWTRQEALRTLAKFKDARAAEPLAQLLPGNPQERSLASQALKDLGPAAEKAVQPFVRHADVFARQEACNILGVIGTELSLPLLTEVSKDTDGRVRWPAQQALATVQVRIRFPAVLRGEDNPKDNAERLTFAQIANDRKKFAFAARLWGEALASDPKLGDDRQRPLRTKAARAALLAAAGQGEGEPPLDDAAKAKLRLQAHDWLKAELTAFDKQPAGWDQVKPWRQDRDLASIRDAEALAILPADEQKQWQAFWAGVEALSSFGDRSDRASNLGSQGKYDEAIAEWRALIRLKPHYAVAYCYLGDLLQLQGDYEGALEMERKGHELGSQQPGWPHPSARWVAEAERNLALWKRIPALLRGEDKPRDNAERLTFAQIANDRKKFAFAARLWGEALASDPKLGDDLGPGGLRRQEMGVRYIAARAAVLAAAGQGQDEPPLDDAAKAKLRGQALDWLMAELASLDTIYAIQGLHTRNVHLGLHRSSPVNSWDSYWLTDSELASIRDAAALAKLPPAEQKSWQTLWAEFDVFEHLHHAAFTAQGSPGSLAACRAAIRLNPDLAGAHAVFGNYLEQCGQHDEAIAEHRTAIRLKPELAAAHLALGTILERQGKLDEAIAEFRTVIRLQPDDVQALDQLRTLPRVYASRGDWKTAAAYAQVFAVQPLKDGELGFEYAAVLLLSGDQAGYRKICAEMLERSGQRDIRPYHVARACTLAPDSVKEAALPGKKAKSELKQSGREYWSLTEQGALAYRAGRDDEAATLLEQSLKADSKPGRAVLDWLWLSLVEQRRGKPAEARAWLEKATKWLAQYPEGIPAKPDDATGLHLHNWLEAQVLRREAERALALVK